MSVCMYVLYVPMYPGTAYVLYVRLYACLYVRKKKKTLQIKGGSTRSLSVGKSLWKRQWTCRKTDCGMMNELSRHVCKTCIYWYMYASVIISYKSIYIT
jgi:hypothetical protein